MCFGGFTSVIVITMGDHSAVSGADDQVEARSISVPHVSHDGVTKRVSVDTQKIGCLLTQIGCLLTQIGCLYRRKKISYS